MSFLQLEPSQVHLKGISRATSFTIRNPNEFLAASYELSFKSSSPRLSLFPEKGILLAGQSQKIKIKYLGSTIESSVQEFSELIWVRFTFKVQYNKILLTKRGMKGWQKIPSQVQQRSVAVHVGGEKEAIQQFIKEDIIFNQEFKDSKLNLSAIHSSNNKSFINENSFDNLAIDSKIESPGPSEREKKTCGTGLELPIEELCPLQYGESRASNFKRDRASMMRYEMVESKIVEDVNQSFELSMKTAQNQDFTSFEHLPEKSGLVHSKSKGGQLVILAIIAAFFVALGNNIGKVFH